MRFPYRGAGIGLVFEDKILLGLRSKKPFMRTWCVPGGGFDKAKDKDDLSNAVREFEEETGIRFDRCWEFLGSFSLSVPFFSWKTFFFKVDSELTSFAPDEFYSLKWFHVSEIKKETAGFALRPFAVSEIRKLKSLL